MKLVLNLSFSFVALLTFSTESFSLTDFKIKSICKKERRKASCIKSLKEKRSNLQRGNLIEIPVIPFRK